YAKEGGTVELVTPAERQDAPALSDDQVAELVTLGQQIETHYGAPQDIEWAYAQGRFYILQTRAITTLTPPAAQAAGETEYNRTMFLEFFPEPLSPVFLSAIQPMFQSMLDFTVETWGFKPPPGIDAVGVFYNQPYFNRGYIAAALEPLSPQVREPMVSQMVNPFGHHKQGKRGELSLAFVGMMTRLLRFMVSFPDQLPGVVAGYQAEVAEVAALPLEATPDREVVTHIRELVFGTASRLMNYDYLMIVLIKRTYQILGLLLERYFGEEAEEISSKLISGVTGNVTMETNKALWDLAQVAKDSPTVSNLLRRYSEREVRAYLEQTPEARAFLDELERFL
ncbi:MAG: hypothetical protein KAX26_03845, partial [Anaerolineae bacterium]|nr:hypothetical protein [Anaerolineae bacterium]